jgi:hypothetical protein
MVEGRIADACKINFADERDIVVDVVDVKIETG